MGLCTIAFCMANLYVNVEVNQPFHYDLPKNEGNWCTNHACSGPLTVVKIGMPVYLNRDDMLLYYGYRHQSFIEEHGDHGANGWFVSFTWMPFK